MLPRSKILSIHNQFPSEVARKYGLYGGVGYYRQVMPAKYLQEYTFVHAGKDILDTPPENMNRKIADLVHNSNLVYTKHLDNPRAIYMLLGACDFYNVPLIVDFDDHVLTTDGLSPDKYSYEESSEHKHYLTILLEECTAITVSTKPLLDVYSKYNPNVYLCPNACDPQDWHWALRHHQRPTVGWAGSASHAKDHVVLEDVYKGVITENPDVVFSFVGHMLPEHIKGMRRRNWEIKPGITWWEGNPESTMTYPRLLAESGYDVGLAPLIESQFNQARSLAKWFEYSLAGIPMVASQWGPYLDLEDTVDAYLVKTSQGWVEAINYLLKNKDERDRIITNSRQRIHREFTIERTLPAWREVFSRYIGRGFSGG